MLVRIKAGTELRDASTNAFAGKLHASYTKRGAVIRSGLCFFRMGDREVFCDSDAVEDTRPEMVGPANPPAKQSLFLVTELTDDEAMDNYFGYAILRAGSLKEAHVVFEAWFDNLFGDNAFQESKVRVDFSSLDSEGPSTMVWEAGLR